MNEIIGPLLTLPVHALLTQARDSGVAQVHCSLDLGRSQTEVQIAPGHWTAKGHRYPYAEVCKDRTIYHWDGSAFAPVARFGGSLIKLVPTQWGAPTFEIDGIKMLPTARVSPYADAQAKVALIQPQDKQVLDTCGGLGYFASWCLLGGARRVVSFEKNPDVIWLRSLNPWSPEHLGNEHREGRFSLEQGDVAQRIVEWPEASFDAALHDPPRFGIAGELYAQTFYHQLARVLRPGARLFHYTGTPNQLTSGRDVPAEVGRRLQRAGFTVERRLDGLLAIKAAAARRR